MCAADQGPAVADAADIMPWGLKSLHKNAPLPSPPGPYLHDTEVTESLD